MKEFLSNYGFWIYLGLTVLNYVFMYFRTKKTKFSSVFDSFGSSIQKVLNSIKEQKEKSYITTELLDSLSRDQIVRVVDYLCDKLQNSNKEGDI